MPAATYAAPQVMYAPAQQYEMAPQMAYAAPAQQYEMAPQMAYAAPMTYAAPAAYAAPMAYGGAQAYGAPVAYGGGQNLTQDQLFAQIDTNGDGSISRSEMAQWRF